MAKYLHTSGLNCCLECCICKYVMEKEKQSNSKLGFTFTLITPSSYRRQPLCYSILPTQAPCSGKINMWRQAFLGSKYFTLLSHCFRENTLTLCTNSNSNILYNLILDIISIVPPLYHLKFKSNSKTELQCKTKV